ncbi:MAG TPA: immunoglobulin-like domain-containing protein, partial [Negativicutes bacterium]|nr:immunoglobulin-like domain-containing protein [Negativicutes bacterium]
YTQSDGNQGPVTAKLTVSDDSSGDITITSQGGSSHVFDKNGQFIFEFTDKAGNKGRALAEVSSLNKAASRVDISYSTRYPTKGNVKVTMLPEAGTTLKSGDTATVLENGTYSFTATDNGQWKFTFVNQAGVETEAAVAVGNIDRTPPKLNVEYYKNTYNNSVVALVSSGEQIWAPAGGSLTHVFSTNGQYSMKAVDEAGNEASIVAAVDNIEALGSGTSGIDVKVSYSTQTPTNKPVKLTLTSDRAFTVLNNGGRTEKEVTRSGRYQFIVKDSLGMIKIVEAKVMNIDTEAPAITLGYNENTSAIAGDLIDPMNFTAVDNFDGDVKAKVKVEGNINTQQPGTYQMMYTVADSSGNTAVKTFTIRVLGSDEQIVTINGIKHESEPLMLGASRLEVVARGFAEQYGIKWTKGYETEAFFKASGTEAASGIIPLSETGWFTLYIYDAERNSRLVHVYISDLGGGQ